MKRILIVEDDDLLREIYEEKLKDDLNVDVLTASTGKEGIKVITHHPNIDLIISDITMPEGSGFDVLQHLKNLNLEIPLIFFSSNIDPEVETEYENYLGAVDKNHFNQLYELITRQIQS